MNVRGGQRSRSRRESGPQGCVLDVPANRPGNRGNENCGRTSGQGMDGRRRLLDDKLQSRWMDEGGRMNPDHQIQGHTGGVGVGGRSVREGRSGKWTSSAD